MGRVAVLGGYGNFGKRISRSLVSRGVDVVVTGRNADKAKTLAEDLGEGAAWFEGEIPRDFSELVERFRPSVVINTVGPFQNQTYDVARAAIAAGVHYIDLADGRAFVRGIPALDAEARAAGVAIISGASTVPALSDAVLAEYCTDFEQIHTLRYGITPGQKVERGLATAQGVLSYIGRPLEPFPGVHKAVYGWQNLYRQRYPELGRRWMANCDIPDLDILPERYGLSSIQFSAGFELGALHLGLWGASWFIRAGLPIHLDRFARPLLRVSDWFNGLGSADGGMHIVLTGQDANDPQAGLERSWYLVARGGDGPHIPTIPAILLAERIAKGDVPDAGARPCVGLVTLKQYLDALAPLQVETFTTSRSIEL